MGNCLKRLGSSSDNDSENQKKKQDKSSKYIDNNSQVENTHNHSQLPLQQQQQNSQKQQQLQKPQNQPEKPLKSWEIRRQNKDLNLDHYRAKNIENQTIVRLPGSLKGGQFAMKNCKNCQIYLYDQTSFVTMDDCTGCTVFIGPSESSVFVRSTTNSKLMLCCGQFRSRDCFDLKIGLFCNSQPVIESSERMEFFCFQYNYLGFKQQFEACNFNVWKNNWSDVYDFTPGKFQPGRLNYSYLEEKNFDPNTFMPLVDKSIAVIKDSQQNSEKPNKNNNNGQQQQNDGEQIQNLEDDSEDEDELFEGEQLESFGERDDSSRVSQKEKQSSHQISQNNGQFINRNTFDIPISTGLRPKNDQNSVLYYFKPIATEKKCLENLEKVAVRFNEFINSQSIYLRRSTIINLEEDQAVSINLQQLANQKMMFVYIGGNTSNIDQIFCSWINRVGENAEDLILQKHFNEEAQKLVKVIFENWNDERKK